MLEKQEFVQKIGLTVAVLHPSNEITLILGLGAIWKSIKSNIMHRNDK